MDYTKLIMEGRWVNRGTVDEPNWQLMVYPVVTKLDYLNSIEGSFVLMDTDKFIGRSTNDTVFRIFDKVVTPTKDVTLHNFGDYTDGEGVEWQLFLTVSVPYIKDNAFAARTIEGYVFLDDIKPKDTDDDLDMWIYESLSKLTGPTTIRFNKDQ